VVALLKIRLHRRIIYIYSMTRKILVLTMSQQQSNYEVSRLEVEAGKRGVEINRALYKDLEFKLENGLTGAYIKGEKIDEENYGAVWFRVAGTKTGKYIEARNLLIRILRNKNIFVTNGQSYLDWSRMGKISQYGVFAENEIPVVPTRIFYTKEQILNSEMMREAELGWPVIAKFERGYQGKSVRKFKSEEEVREWLKDKDEKWLGTYLWQRYLPSRWDLRVIVLGGKVIGAMKRSALGSEFRSNFSLGGKVEKWDLSEDDARLAEKVARVCKLDYCGVDIMKDSAEKSAKSYVLEVNRQCQFKGFEESTGINVAGLVVDILKEKL